MTFSFRPRRLSTLPSTAASARTVFVSWKDAADRKLSVAREALVMPRSWTSLVAGRLPSLAARSFSRFRISLSTWEPSRKRV